MKNFFFFFSHVVAYVLLLAPFVACMFFIVRSDLNLALDSMLWGIPSGILAVGIFELAEKFRQ